MALVFHPSIELVQHGGKSLAEALTYAKKIGVTGVQLSHFHLFPDSKWLDVQSIQQAMETAGIQRLDGISAHCLLWVHGTAWTGSPSIRQFIPKSLWTESTDAIERWAEERILELLDLSAELGNKVIPMFWGLYHGLEIGSGYPWGMWNLPKKDLMKEGDERFVTKTLGIRQRARDLEISLAHEIHPGTAAMCADDFLSLVDLVDDDECMGVNADPSHCWEGEDYETRFSKVASYVTACHVKDFIRVPGRALRSMQSNWGYRGMQFTRLGEGEVNLSRYAQLMVEINYPQRYRDIQGLAANQTVPLVGEAESAHYELDEVSAHATEFIRDTLCVGYTTQSFEEGMKA